MFFKHPVVNSRYFNLELWDNLQAAKQQGTRIPIVNIAHFTKLPFARKIVESGGFSGRKKKINEDAKGRDVIPKFSWWSPVFLEDDIKRVRYTLGAAIQPFLAELSDRFHGDGSDQDHEIDTEKSGDQDMEEGSDQNDEIDHKASKKDDDDDDDDQDDDQDALVQLQKQFASSHAFNPNALNSMEASTFSITLTIYVIVTASISTLIMRCSSKFWAHSATRER